VRDFGYELVQSDDYTVRFERRPIFVTIDYDAVRSHEISIWVGHGNDAEPPFEPNTCWLSTGAFEAHEPRRTEGRFSSESASRSKPANLR
jgi:hypothetical protein